MPLARSRRSGILRAPPAEGQASFLYAKTLGLVLAATRRVDQRARVDINFG